MDIHGIKIHLQYVVRGAPLHRMYERGEYRCLERAEYADILSDFLALLPKTMVIHRLTGDPHRDELVAPSWRWKGDYPAYDPGKPSRSRFVQGKTGENRMALFRYLPIELTQHR